MKTLKKTVLILLSFVILISSSAIPSLAESDFDDEIDEYPYYTNNDPYPNERYMFVDFAYYIDSQAKLATIPPYIFEGKVISISYDLYNRRTQEFGVPESEEPVDYFENRDLFLYTVYEIEISKTYKGDVEGTIYMGLPGGRRSEDRGITWNDALDQFEYFKSIGVGNSMNVVTYTDEVKSCDLGKNYLFFAHGPYNPYKEYYEMADQKLYALEEGTSGDQFGYVEMKEFLESNPDLLHAGSGDAVTGDVNGDGSADSADATMILRYDAGLIELDDGQLAAADFNGDGSVDSADSTAILRADAGLE